MTDHPIPVDVWHTIVQHVPIVSVDLVVRQDDGIVLGKRTNPPAKDEWFVPGGRVYKHERFSDAVCRVARTELGVDVSIRDRLGTYEHFYDQSEMPSVGGKHYVSTAFVVDPASESFESDNQHGTIETFYPPFDFDLHPYVEAYLRDADIIG